MDEHPRPTAIATRLRAHGLRATSQRVQVLAELLREPNDATAGQIHDRLRHRGARIGLATVYRSLDVLAQSGVVDTLDHVPGTRCYRACTADHHHHLVCSRCHTVVELGDCKLDPWLTKVSAEHGFLPTDHRLEVTGLCARCREVA